MGKQRSAAPPRRRSNRLSTTLGALVLVAIGAAAFWWFFGPLDAGGGTPRLVLDREVIDLGALPFEAPARAVFTLANSGDGPLRLAGVPRVIAVQGC